MADAIETALRRVVAVKEILGLVLEGRELEAAKRAAELALDVMPVEDLKAFLTDAAARRAEAIANAAEDLKFGRP